GKQFATDKTFLAAWRAAHRVVAKPGAVARPPVAPSVAPQEAPSVAPVVTAPLPVSSLSMSAPSLTSTAPVRDAATVSAAT
ncbi:MAG: DNA polymerase III subunit gamma/tau, partial [Gemmatimonadaceae bacterium]